MKEDCVSQTHSIEPLFNYLIQTAMAVLAMVCTKIVLCHVELYLYLFLYIITYHLIIDPTCISDEFVEIISKTSLHQNIPFPLENSDFVKLYFGLGCITVIVTSEFL